MEYHTRAAAQNCKARERVAILHSYAANLVCDFLCDVLKTMHLPHPRILNTTTVSCILVMSVLKYMCYIVAESVSCQCDDGWQGRLCATSIDDCASNPCPNYARCIDGHLSYTCKIIIMILLFLLP